MAAALIPDLLARDPGLRVDAIALRQAIVFAFAVSGNAETFDEALAGAVFPASRWDRTQFARDVFLEQLVERCLAVKISGRTLRNASTYVLNAISQPAAGRDLEFRHAVLEELVSVASLRADLEQVYVDLVGLKALLCTDGHLTPMLRRLEILRCLHGVFGRLASSFEGARSGLGRLRAFGRRVCDGQAYQRLTALLDHEEHMGTVDVRVRVGSDGELRTFQIVSVRENHENPFHASVLGRWLTRIALFFRGYRMNGGDLVERFFDDVFTGLEDDLPPLFQLLGDAEFHLGALHLRDAARAKGLAVSLPEITETPAAGVALDGLFNPLLLGERAAPVPCELVLDHPDCVAVVTGPNSGGKTRLLQSIAIAQILGEAGMFVPARSARLRRVSGLFVSLLEEARADQPEGHLGMELLRIRRMFEHLTVGSLVLLDELCAGTNPSEGEEIARLVIELLPELRTQVFVTTHLLDFAARLSSERPIERLQFLQVELDPYERPTYRFVPGVAKTSLAHRTAARLGVTRGELKDLIADRKRDEERIAAALRRAQITNFGLPTMGEMAVEDV